MSINRTTFFNYVRKAPFGGRLIQSQIDGMNAVLDAWENFTSTDVRWLAYMLATMFHETAATMQPVRETLAKSDAQAIANLDKAFKSGRLRSVKTPYWRKDANGLSWFGRGLVQLTFLKNYKRMADILGIPLDTNPSLALDLDTAIQIMFEGMTKGASSKGDFTGKSLENYFNATIDNPEGARAIINGTDKAKLVAGYHRNFLDAINEAMKAERYGMLAADVTKEAAKADDVPAHKSKSLLTVLSAIGGSGVIGIGREVSDSGANFLSAVSNPWSLAAFLSLVAVCVLGWLIFTGRLTINRGGAPVK